MADHVKQEPNAALLAVLCFALLSSIYLFTYSGRLITTDDALILGQSQSLVLTGTFSANLDYPTRLDAYHEGTDEPVYPLVGASLYWLATRLHLGTVHTILLANIPITALAAVLVFALARRTGSRHGTALLVALVFGLATIAWPYSKTLLRDVLAMLFLLLAVYLLETSLAENRAPSARGILALLAGAACVAAILTKDALAGALPAVLLVYGAELLGEWRIQPRQRRLTLAAGFGGVAILGVLVMALSWKELSSNPLIARGLDVLLHGAPDVLGTQNESFWPALLGHFGSPGKSVFLYSPPLILAPLSFRWANSRQARLLWLSLLALLGLAIIHAVYLDWLWFDGVGWGLRGLYPAVPLLVAASAPAVDAALRAPRRWPRVALGALVALGVLVQIGAVSVFLGHYYDMIGVLGERAAWTIGLWSPAHSALLGQWQLLAQGFGFDFLWWRALYVQGPAALIAVALMLAAALAAGLGLRAALRGAAAGRRALYASIGLAVLAITVVPYILLRAGYEDHVFYAARAEFRAAVVTLKAGARPDDAVVVRAIIQPLWRYFTNYAQLSTDWYSLADEQDSAQHTVLPKSTLDLFEALPGRARRVWLVSDMNARGGDARVEERWLAEHYPVLSSEDITVDHGHVRLALFALTPFNGTEQLVGARFGPDIVLERVQLSSPVVAPGEVIGVRLAWAVDRTPDSDYVAGLYLLAPDGHLVAQQDMAPVNGMQPFNTLTAGEELLDHRGLIVPGDAAPGIYSLALAVYDWRTGTRLPVQVETRGDQLLVIGQVEVSPLATE